MNVTPDLTQVPLAIPKSGEKEMLTISHADGVTTVLVNFSSLSIIQECPRKAMYVLRDGLKSRTESPALLFGTACHKGLEVFYSHPREARALPVRFAEHMDLMAHGTPAPEDHFIYRATQAALDIAQPLNALPDTDKHSLSSLVWVMQHYFKNYINDPFEVYVDAQGPVVERRCQCTIHEEPGLRIILHGTVDAVLENKQTGVVLGVDHKTSSIVGNDFYNRLKPNPQYSGYVLMIQKALNINTDKFMINCLQKKARPLTKRGTPPDFPRQVTDRTVEDLADYVKTVVSYVKAYLQFDSENFWPMGSVNSCTHYGGCQFLEACRAPLSIRENVINNMFVRRGHGQK